MPSLQRNGSIKDIVVAMHLTSLLLPLSYCSRFVCTCCSVPTAFPEGLRGAGEVPSPLHKVERCWPPACSNPVAPWPHPAQHLAIDVRCLFSGVPAVAGSPGGWGGISHPPGLLSRVFQPIFTSSSVLHRLQRRETATRSKPADITNS